MDEVRNSLVDIDVVLDEKINLKKHIFDVPLFCFSSKIFSLYKCLYWSKCTLSIIFSYIKDKNLERKKIYIVDVVLQQKRFIALDVVQSVKNVPKIITE